MRREAASYLLLALTGLITVAWYTPQLGFYSDDWAFLAPYVNADDQSLSGFYDAAFSPHHAMRPVQLWLCAGLYALFGLNPLGYHLFNAALIVVNPMLAYAVGRDVGVRRMIALPVALLYAALPSYSTDRFWFVAFAITLSMTACLVSIRADVRAVITRSWRSVLWKILAVVAAVISGLSYEVALPLLLVAPLLMFWRARRPDFTATESRRSHVVVMMLLSIVVVAGIAAFKAQTTVRLGAASGLLAQVRDIASHAFRTDVADGAYGLNAVLALKVHFGDSGLFLVPRAFGALTDVPVIVTLILAACGVAVFFSLTAMARDESWPPLKDWGFTVLAGLALFALGYAIFVTNYNVQFTAAGVANRSAIVAALGAAATWVGITGWVASFMKRATRHVFALVVVLLMTAGSILVNATAARWITAYDEERRVLAAIEQRLPQPVQHTTVILDGVCPYVGPAIVFESNWDLAGALQILYKDPSLTADVVTPRLRVEDSGIVTSIYGQETTYPYGERLVVFNAEGRTISPLPDAATARRYFASTRAAVRSCPPGHEGIGELGPTF